jgi:hypothetical protein
MTHARKMSAEMTHARCRKISSVSQHHSRRAHELPQLGKNKQKVKKLNTFFSSVYSGRKTSKVAPFCKEIRLIIPTYLIGAQKD